MATKVGGQLGLNNPIRQVGTSQSNDVWVSQEQVVEEWGLGEESLWARLVDRQNEILTTGGIACNLWRTLDTGLACTCRKSETSQPNARCQVCYGTGFVGGFEKFGFSTIFIAANTPNLTLSDIIVAQKQPDQFEIAPGKTTGTILTPRFQITRNFKYVKSLIYGFDGLRVQTRNGILVEYTSDGGTTFTELLAGDTTPLSEPALNVQFRIRLSRGTIDDPSPYFQILRARWQMEAVTEILVSKKSFPEQRWLESFGVRVKMDGITWWTTPNLGIPGHAPIVLEEDDLFEITEGAFKPQTLGDEEFPVSGRFKPTNVTTVEPRGRFLSQRFNVRMLQRDEPAVQVF